MNFFIKEIEKDIIVFLFQMKEKMKIMKINLDRKENFNTKINFF